MWRRAAHKTLMALLHDLTVIPVLSAVIRLARTAALSFVSHSYTSWQRIFITIPHKSKGPAGGRASNGSVFSFDYSNICILCSWHALRNSEAALSSDFLLDFFSASEMLLLCSISFKSAPHRLNRFEIMSTSTFSWS